MTLNKRCNWNSCTNLGLSGRWTHCLIAQSIRASEPNSVIVGSHPTQSNFLYLLQGILHWWIPYVPALSAVLMWLTEESLDEKKRSNGRRNWPKWNMTLNKWSHWSSSTKLALNATWTHGLIPQSFTASEWNSLTVGKESHSGLLSIATSKNTSVANTTCINSFRWTHLITSRKYWWQETWWLKKAMNEMKHDIEQTIELEELYKVGCVYELYSWPDMILGSNPTRANFLYLLQRILQLWIPFVSAHSATLIWLPQRNFEESKRGDWRRQWSKWNTTLRKRCN